MAENAPASRTGKTPARSSVRGVARFLPSGLYGRAAVILILPILALYLIIAASFIQRVYEGITLQMTENMAVEIHALLEEELSYPDLVRQAGKREILISQPNAPIDDDHVFYGHCQVVL